MRLDFAEVIKALVDEIHPQAERIVLVLDHLNTHSPASLYEAFPAQEARRLTEKIEIHYTPKPGSWLNMVEIELGVLARQCLDPRRLENRSVLAAQVAALEQERNSAKVHVDWRFSTQDARLKLKHLYPSIQPCQTTR